MKKLFYILSITSVCFFSCSATNNQPDCENMICTQEFRMVQVVFKDSVGKPLNVKAFSAVNKRTGENMARNSDPSNEPSQGVYIVASDADVRKLSEKGDVIQVSASHPVTNKNVISEFVVTGGICACHINKISGPSEIVL
ncbi:MAG: hypothetical protein ACO1NS_01125 [Daejeonella sp.]